jgi:flavodoxin/ferredoxin
MDSDKSKIGRRKFLLTAGVVSTSALTLNKLNSLMTSGSANAAETTPAKTANSKCAVIFSSMTGNTEKVARSMQKALEEAAGGCDIFPVKEANPHKFAGYDLIAFGYPLMGPQLKMDVDTFLTNMRYVGGKHIFLFSTSDSADNNHGKCIPKLKEHGMVTIGSKSWHGAVYGPLGDPTPGGGDGHPDKADLADAAAYAKQMWELSRKIYAGDKSLIPAEPARSGERGTGGGPEGQGGGASGGPPAGAMAGAAGAANGSAGGPPAGGAGFNRGEMDPELVGLENDTPEQLKKRIHFNLIYDQSKCQFPLCHRCQDICPVSGIDFTVEPRVYGNPCMMCAMCDQVCPTGSISVDEAHMKWQRKVEKYGDNIKQVYQAYPYRPRFVVGLGRPYGYDPYTKEDRGPYKGAASTETSKK